MRAIAACLLLSLASCTSAQRFIKGDLVPYDENTKYRIDEMEEGFKLSVLYEKYQFAKDRDSVADDGFERLQSIAMEIACERGKKIKQLDRDFIKIGTGRDWLKGVTSWAGIAKVEYRD